MDSPHDVHVQPEEFLAVLGEFGERPWRQAIAAQLHLFGRCPECAARLLRAFELERWEEIEAMDDPILTLGQRLRRARGAAVVAWLESLPAAERRAALGKDAALHTQALLCGLLERVKQLWCTAPQLALELSELAVELAPRLVEQPGDLDETDDLPALAWAVHGNVLRILSDLPAADRAFRRATRVLAGHRCEDLIIAEVEALKASLRRDQRRYREAQTAVDKAIRLYGRWGRWHEQGQELLTSAKIRCEAGELEAALFDLDRAVPLLDLLREPRLEWVAESIRLHLLVETGRHRTALDHLPQARTLARQHGGVGDGLRVRWCEGLVEAALGGEAKAEAAFREVRDGFIELGIAYDAALVSLDLAVLFARQGRAAELRSLASEMLAIFESRGVEREALAAALLFCGATLGEVVSAEAMLEVRRWLRARRPA